MRLVVIKAILPRHALEVANKLRFNFVVHYMMCLAEFTSLLYMKCNLKYQKYPNKL
jgi:hypothetical protein